ncbi:helix-turn-helix transcriptional regulator [Bacillus sp. MMSF_3328]|uniref:helix-turn-helix transcriptional regulator n=1 Tax=Bacillus sp. MMSF_3328 TaxID=3047080 RepID=UPI00273D1623|nr:helix-turn-helix transcriptional regulator [Bacillus sp. MMSF_3328]
MKREWLIRDRQLMGLTQEEVAKKVGISRSYYNQIETGERNPSGSVALRIATYFQFDMSKFFCGKCCETQHLKGVR